MGIRRVKVKPDQRLGNDSVYGLGPDGTTVINGTVIMNRDHYYNNLTINANSTLFTNGYRVFVAGTLTMHSGSKLGMPSSVDDVNTFGTLIGRADDIPMTKVDSEFGSLFDSSVGKPLRVTNILEVIFALFTDDVVSAKAGCDTRTGIETN